MIDMKYLQTLKKKTMKKEIERNKVNYSGKGSPPFGGLLLADEGICENDPI